MSQQDDDRRELEKMIDLQERFIANLSELEDANNQLKAGTLLLGLEESTMSRVVNIMSQLSANDEAITLFKYRIKQVREALEEWRETI